MTIGFNTLFQQRDVRVTPTETGGTFYLSIPPSGFKTTEPDTEDVFFGPGSLDVQSGTVTAALAAVQLPHGAVVTGAIVYGNDAAEQWWLKRVDLDDGGDVDMAGATFNTEDTSISYATIDNSLYSYCFSTTGLDAADLIYGARITYTT